MEKNNNLSQLDTNQMVQKMFDENLDAQRVSIVGGKLNLGLDPEQIKKALEDGFKNITIKAESPEWDSMKPQIIERNVFIPEIQIVEKQVFIPQIEYKTIEIPVIQKEIEYRTIEVPMIIKEYITVEIPVIQKEVEFKEIIKERDYPLVIKVCNVVQAVAIMCILLLNFLRK